MDSGLRQISSALAVTNASVGGIAWLQNAGLALGAINNIGAVHGAELQGHIDALKNVLMHEIEMTTPAVASNLRTQADSVEVDVQTWLDANLPALYVLPGGPYAVRAENQNLRALRRACVLKDMGQDGQNTMSNGQAKMRHVRDAVNMPTINHNWSPGSKCHAYTEVAHAIYGGERKSIFVNLLLNEPAAQKQAYIDAVFRNQAGTNLNRIAHSFLVTNTLADGTNVVVDVTYNQFFKYRASDWPPILSGDINYFNGPNFPNI